MDEPNILFDLKCPVRGEWIFPDVPMLEAKRPLIISCPHCGQSHLWDPNARKITEAPDDLSWAG